MTLRKLSAKSHVSLGHLSEVEQGRKQPSNELLESLAQGLDLTTTELIGEIYEHLKEHHG